MQAYIAVGKQQHGYTLDELFRQQGKAQLPENAKEKMAHKLKSPQGRELYGTVEPVFGIIKECMRFRQFLMRGKDKVSNEWNLVCTAYNLKRTFNRINARQAAALADSRLCAF